MLHQTAADHTSWFGGVTLCRPGRCPEIPEICPEIGVRSWNLYIYPEIFTRFHNFFKNTHHFTFFTYE